MNLADGGKNFVASWPDDWPFYHNSCNEPCDMAIGPCCCGAWHQEGEFEYVFDMLFRDGVLVWQPPGEPIGD